MFQLPLHRRRIHLPGLLALTSLAACGDDDTDDTASASATAETTTTASDDAYPVTIEHKFGTVEIEEMPERVVSLGYTEQDAIVLFGIEPVAVRYAFGPEDDLFFPWADGLAGDADPEMLARAEVNVEQVAALEPDVIMAVTAGLTEDEYTTLSEIAPVVVPPEGYVDYGVPWDVHTLLAGRVFGQEDKAEQIIDDVQQQIVETAAAHPELDGLTLALSGPTYDGEYPFHSSDDTRTRFFTDLGLVVTEGRSLFVEGSDYDALQFVSALSIPYLLENLVPKLAALAR
jgi:iron complex transport system substrate-binding protein